MAPTTRAGVVIQDETAKFKQFCMGKVKGAAQRTASVALKGGATGVMLVGKGGLGVATAFKDFLLETVRDTGPGVQT